MSIEKAIEVGEKAVQELEAKKEAERLAKLSPEEKQAEAEKAKATAKAAEDQKILDSKDEELDEATKAKKQALIEAKEKEAQAEEARILQAKEEELSEEERATKEISWLKS
jgi:hypothetical protein